VDGRIGQDTGLLASPGNGKGPPEAAVRCVRKLCMELIGLDYSRCRPPTRDVQADWRERCRTMMIQTGVPGC